MQNLQADYGSSRKRLDGLLDVIDVNIVIIVLLSPLLVHLSIVGSGLLNRLCGGLLDPARELFLKRIHKPNRFLFNFVS